jgi:hypothetical protein
MRNDEVPGEVCNRLGGRRVPVAYICRQNESAEPAAARAEWRHRERAREKKAAKNNKKRRLCAQIQPWLGKKMRGCAANCDCPQHHTQTRTMFAANKIISVAISCYPKRMYSVWALLYGFGMRTIKHVLCIYGCCCFLRSCTIVRSSSLLLYS